MFLARRSLRILGGPHRAARRRPGHGVEGAVGETRRLRETHGLVVQMGVIGELRLQPRLPRVLHGR